MSKPTPITLSFDITTGIITSLGRILKLTPLEAGILKYVMERAGVFVPLVDLIVNVWGDLPDSAKTSYDEVIRNLIRRLQRELALPDRLLVYQRKRLVCRLTAEAAARVMVTGVLNIAGVETADGESQGLMSATPLSLKQSSENQCDVTWPYTYTLEMPRTLYEEMQDLNIDLHRRQTFETAEQAFARMLWCRFITSDCDIQGVRDAVDDLFLAWYNRIAALVGIPNPETAYQEGRFGPMQLSMSSMEWRFVLSSLMSRIIQAYPKEMNEFGKPSGVGYSLRVNLFSAFESWRPAADGDVRPGDVFIRLAVPFKDKTDNKEKDRNGIEDHVLPNPILPSALPATLRASP